MSARGEADAHRDLIRYVGEISRPLHEVIAEKQRRPSLYLQWRLVTARRWLWSLPLSQCGWR